ncbi:hypothetical protein BHE74_00014145 [Ensete ventricosum]|nr:hypothetical protein BHE74_00014145 [Ensete ventricosum]
MYRLTGILVCNTELYRPYEAVHTGPPADQYVDCSLPDSTIEWGYFCPDFDRRHPLPGGINRGRWKKRAKKRKNLEIWCHSPSMILIRRCSPNTVDEMLPPPRLRQRGLGIMATSHPRREKKQGDVAKASQPRGEKKMRFLLPT